MSRTALGPSFTLTLIAPGPAEEAQATWWRSISWKWPEFVQQPGLQVLGWSDHGTPTEDVRGSVALLIPGADARGQKLFSKLDELREALIPAVVLVPVSDAEPTPPSDEDTIWLPDTTEPQAVAWTLAALAARQIAVDALRTEVRISRRFQSGLRGQIEKVHEELQLAASVQREFLPKALPALPNIDVQVLFRPCGYVSGDIYDVQRLDDHHLGFFVADAVGHGVPAALMTMVLCRCLTTTEHEDGALRIVNPGRALQLLNQDLIRRHGEGSRFATAVYGVVDTRTRRVTLSGAGHPYPLRIREGSVDKVETEGGLLGIFAEDEFNEVSFTLEPDELLVIYTDGFETAFPPTGADEYGRRLPNRNYIERFAEMADGWRRDGLPHAVRRLVEHMDHQAGSLHQSDDLTAMVIVPSVETPLDQLFSGRLEAEPPAKEPGPGRSPVRFDP